MSLRVVAGLGSLLVASVAVRADVPVEVSEDGRAVLVGARATEPALPRRRGTGPALPFAAAPSWQNTIRVQVGGLAFGDLDDDGLPDLALVCYQSSSFPPYDDWRNFVYFNTGTALETDASWVSDDEQHSGDAVIVDVDGNGYADLVSINGGSAYAPNVIYFGSAAGLATAPGWSSAQPAWATSAVVADLDGDTDLDLLTSNQGRSQADPYRPMYLFRSNAGVLETTPSWQSAEASIQNSIALANLDGDADPDIGVAKWVNFESALYRNDGGTPTSAPTWTSGTTGGDRGIELADIDRDGAIDIVLGVGNTLKILRNTGPNTYTEVWAAAQTASHQDLLVADFDNDQWLDIVDVDFSTGRTYLYLNRNGLPATTPDWSYDAQPVGTALAAADVDGDGWLDLAIGYSGVPSAVVFINQLEADPPVFADGFES